MDEKLALVSNGVKSDAKILNIVPERISTVGPGENPGRFNKT